MATVNPIRARLTGVEQHAGSYTITPHGLTITDDGWMRLDFTGDNDGLERVLELITNAGIVDDTFPDITLGRKSTKHTVKSLIDERDRYKRELDELRAKLREVIDGDV